MYEVLTSHIFQNSRSGISEFNSRLNQIPKPKININHRASKNQTNTPHSLEKELKITWSSFTKSLMQTQYLMPISTGLSDGKLKESLIFDS